MCDYSKTMTKSERCGPKLKIEIHLFEHASFLRTAWCTCTCTYDTIYVVVPSYHITVYIVDDNTTTDNTPFYLLSHIVVFVFVVCLLG
jgi:hypothetical protein